MTEQTTQSDLDLAKLLKTPEATEGGARPPQHADPAPDPVDAARQATANFVGAISRKAQLALTDRRDEIDNLMRRIQVSEAALVDYIGKFAQFSAEVITMSDGIKAEIENATLPFKADPPATLTQNGASNATVK